MKTTRELLNEAQAEIASLKDKLENTNTLLRKYQNHSYDSDTQLAAAKQTITQRNTQIADLRGRTKTGTANNQSSGLYADATSLIKCLNKNESLGQICVRCTGRYILIQFTKGEITLTQPLCEKCKKSLKFWVQCRSNTRNNPSITL